MKFSKTKTSICVDKNVFIASSGLSTMGSPLSLNEVFNTTGVPESL